MAGAKRIPITERFLNKVSKQENGCWLWTAFCMKNGYGLFSFEGANRLAHRISYQIFVGELDGELDVMHSCDNPGCVNPEHLSLGTRQDNMRDAKAKKRNAFGEKHGRSLVTAEQAIAIRNAEGRQEDIGKKYGISQTAVWEIKTRRTWAHI